MSNFSSALIKLIVADDHQLFADGLEQILDQRSGFDIIAKVSNGKLLMQTLNRLVPDMILLDINMPLMDGLETALLIKQRQPKIKIVFISMTYGDDYKSFLQKNKIEGFINKNITASEFKNALQEVMDGKHIFISPSLCNESTTTVSDYQSEFLKHYKITKTETEIIPLIASGDSTKIIAAKRGLSYLTVESHRKNIFRKLQARNMADVVSFAVKHNIVI